MPKMLRVYLPDGPRNRAEAGKHEFVNRLSDLMRTLGIKIELCPVTPAEKMASLERDEFGIILNEEPWHANMLTLRQAYLHPFWRLESRAERWHSEVAQRRFDPTRMDASDVAMFANDLRQRKFGYDGAPNRNAGFILVPLQGRLTQLQSFQSADPIQMVRDTLHHAEGRPVVAVPDPTITYGDSDRAALQNLLARHPNLSIGDQPIENYLPDCELVVTQNSHAAFMGFFFAKPAVLYAKCDFHHIASNVRVLGVEGAFAAAQSASPAYDHYITWFLRDNAINAARMKSTRRIHAIMKRRGWDI